MIWGEGLEENEKFEIPSPEKEILRSHREKKIIFTPHTGR